MDEGLRDDFEMIRGPLRTTFVQLDKLFCNENAKCRAALVEGPAVLPGSSVDGPRWVGYGVEADETGGELRCRQDNTPASVKNVGRDIKRCEAYFKRLDRAMRSKWRVETMARCPVLMGLLSGGDDAVLVLLKQQQQQQRAVVVHPTTARSVILMRMAPGMKLLMQGEHPLVACLNSEMLAVEAFVDRYCSMIANRLSDFRIAVTSAVPGANLERPFAAVYGALRELVDFAFRNKGSKTATQLLLAYTDAERALERQLAAMVPGMIGGGFFAKVVNGAGSVLFRAAKALAQVVVTAVCVAAVPLLISIALVFGVGAILRDTWRGVSTCRDRTENGVHKTARCLSSVSVALKSVVSVTHDVNMRLAWMLFCAFTYQFSTSEFNTAAFIDGLRRPGRDVVPLVVGTWAAATKLVSRVGAEELESEYKQDGMSNPAFFAPLGGILDQINAQYTNTMYSHLSHFWEWGGGADRGIFEQLIGRGGPFKDIEKHPGDHARARAYIIEACTSRESREYSPYIAAPPANAASDATMYRAVVEGIEAELAGVKDGKLTRAGKLTLLYLRNRVRYFDLMYATIMTLLRVSHDNAQFGNWLYLVFPVRKFDRMTSFFDAHIVVTFTLPSTLLQLFLDMMRYLRDGMPGKSPGLAFAADGVHFIEGDPPGPFGLSEEARANVYAVLIKDAMIKGVLDTAGFEVDAPRNRAPQRNANIANIANIRTLTTFRGPRA